MAKAIQPKKDRVPYWEAFRLDRSWQPPPRRRTILRSTFGPQVPSNRTTSPSFGFGTANRQAFTKMFISPEMAKTKPGNFSPGPAYEVNSSFGKQLESHCESPPEIKIGRGSRWKKRRPEAEPGPGAYDPAGSAFGYQVYQIVKFGQFAYSCPVGIYISLSEHSSNMEDEVRSEKKSPERYVFSRGTRAQADKIFLSQEFNKAKFGTQSPGPMVYGARTTFGKQAASKDRTAPVINFTKGKRTQNKYDAGAGPGEYKIEGSVGKQTESQKVTAPTVAFPKQTRDKQNKVFLSREHDKSHYGETSPGPGSFGQTSSVGNQPLSKCANPPFIRFTKGTRWSKQPEDMPGPGAYDPP